MTPDFQRRLSDAGVGSIATTRSRSLLQRLHIDGPLVLMIYLLLAMGSVVLYSASGGDQAYVKRQLLYAGLGSIAMIVVAQIRPRVMQRWAWLVYLGGLGALLAVLLMGSGAKGAQRWIDLGFFRFQPSEVIKLALPLMLASYLGSSMPPGFKNICVALVLAAIPLALILLQPDLGTGLLVAASGLTVLFLAGLRWRYILAAMALLPMVMQASWLFVLHDYQKQRLITLFNPEADKLGAGWNIIQSITAIGSGGWSGKGWMSGTQSHLDFLPESHTDFIIAVLAEEFGFRGVLIVLTVYILLFIRSLWISFTAKNSFSRLLAGTMTFTAFVYVFVNMAMVAGILPVVGLPLPLFSYGGTSMVSMFTAFGVLMAIATEDETLHAK